MKYVHQKVGQEEIERCEDNHHSSVLESAESEMDGRAIIESY